MKPILWNLLVEPVEVQRTSEGGIELPEEVLEAQEKLAFVGKVVELGSLAYAAKPREGLDYSKETNKPNVGDYVVFGRYSGQRVNKRNGRSLVILADTDIKAVCDSAQEAMEVVSYV